MYRRSVHYLAVDRTLQGLHLIFLLLRLFLSQELLIVDIIQLQANSLVNFIAYLSVTLKLLINTTKTAL